MVDHITVTKLDAARRQLAAAIDLIFSDGDIVAAHTLVGAASNIISDLAKQRVPDRSWDKKAQIDSELSARDYFTIMRKAQNFFKHAKDDPDGVLDFDPSDTDSIAFWAVMNIGELGHDLSMLESVFQLWYIAGYSPVLDDGSDVNRSALEVFGDLRQDTRRARLTVGARVLAQEAKDDN